MHIPVLLDPTVQLWASLDKNEKVKPGIYIDATFGQGGHSSFLLSKEVARESIKIIGIDRDENQIQKAKSRFKKEIENKQLFLYSDNFANIAKIVSTFKRKYKTKLPIKGILFDFGFATNQLLIGKGFSFKEESSPLDMRFDPKNELTAADILNTWSQSELERIFQIYGEERYAKRVAGAILLERRKGIVFRNTSDLMIILKKTLAQSYRKQKIHYATRVFQALRIAVNNELDSITMGLAEALKLLGTKGRLVAISFHSGEDRIVKNFFRNESKDCLCPPNVPSCICGHKKSLQIITRKPSIASEQEIRENPNSRSAKLRAAEKTL